MFSWIISCIRSAESEVVWKFLFFKSWLVEKGWIVLRVCCRFTSSCCARIYLLLALSSVLFVVGLIRIRVIRQMSRKDFVEGSVVRRVGSIGRVAWTHGFEWRTRFTAKLCGWVREHLCGFLGQGSKFTISPSPLGGAKNFHPSFTFRWS